MIHKILIKNTSNKKEEDIWQEIQDLEFRLAQQIDWVRNDRFWGHFERNCELDKTWRKISKALIRLYFMHQQMHHPKHFLLETDIRAIPHPSCHDNILTLLLISHRL